MSRRAPRKIDVEERLRDCERWSTNILWPAAIDLRLKGLVDRAVDAGEAETLSRSEVLAALVLRAPAEGEKLRDIILDYRRARVRDSLIPGAGGQEADPKVIVLDQRRPGRL